MHTQTRYLKEIIQDIKNKKELKNLDDFFVEKKLKEFLNYPSHVVEKNKIIEKLNNSKSYKQFTKSKEYDFLIKNIRAELRKIYGIFVKDVNLSSDNNIEKLLSTHQSTKERQEYYPEIYQQIFSKFPKSSKEKLIILDLACGLNPLSVAYFKDKIKKYYASDISEKDSEFLKKQLDKLEIENTVFAADLTDENNFAKIKKIKCDVCLLFKALDSLERSKRGISKPLLAAIHSKLVVVSFPKATISGKSKISISKRTWFEELLNNCKWGFQKFEVPNELFYVIEK